MPKQAALRQGIVSDKVGSTARGLGIFAHKEKVYLYFQSKENFANDFSISTSEDGFSFSLAKKNVSIIKQKNVKETIHECSRFNISEFGNELLLTYLKRSGKNLKMEKAWSDKPDSEWIYEGDMLKLNEYGLIVPDFTHDKKFVMYSADGKINVYFSKNLVQWDIEKAVLTKRGDLFDSSDLEVAYILKEDKNILVLYYSKINGLYSIGVALFDSKDPCKLLWRSCEPVWTAPEKWKGKIYPLGIVLHEGRIISYWQTETEGIYAAVAALFKISDGHKSKDISLKLQRASHNPIIEPNPKNHWEAFNTFNPAAIYDNGKVHILYRAQGYDYISAIGYATSLDGVHIDERFNQPIFSPSQDLDYVNDARSREVSYQYVSGGGYGGFEDPRITRIKDKYYLTYVAFDGVSPPRIALTSISVDNFLNKRFLWEKPVLISPPGVVDKSAVIFSEKINGKYVIMHRIYPDILIDFVDNLEFDGKTWLEGQYKISPRPESWDSRKIGAGAPPIKTKHGWLLIYQSVGEQDAGKYKIGAMLLDLKDPTKVIHRSQSPILEPDAKYENEGFKAGVIYPCGAVIIKDALYVYYGGADSYVCVATANLEEFLEELIHSKIAKLTEPVFKQIF
nr:hypothetical protein [Candidatus Levybacteria bacterium]